MRQLHIAKDLSLPLGIANKTICIFGKGGSGKSNLEVVLAEELYAAGIPTCIVDPADVHYGIKSTRDGKSAGLPFIIFGGLHADVPIYPENGKLLADLFLDRGLYMVIVTQPWTGGERAKFMTDFANQLYKRGPEKEQRGSARVLLLEEAHEYVPLSPGKDEAVMLGAMKRLYTVGRNYWIGFIAATRRPARMHTDLRNGADATAFFQIVGTQDRKAMTDYLGEMAEKDVRDEILSNVAKLPVGTAYLYQPHETPALQRVHFRYRNTLDTTTTEITAGHKAIKPVLATVDLSKLGEQMEAAREKAKAEDPKELLKTIAELRNQIRKLESAKPATETKVKTETKTVEKKVVVEGTVTRLEKALDRAEKLRDSFQEGVGALNTEVSGIAAMLADARKINEPFQAPPPPKPFGRLDGPVSVKIARVNSATGARSAAAPSSVTLSPGRVAQSNGDISGPMQKILNELAELEAVGISPADKAQLGLFCGYTNVKSGGFTGPLGKLREMELIHYPGSGEVALTDAGRGQAADTGEPLTMVDLQNRIVNKLDGPRAKVLRQLIKLYPDSIDKETLGGQLGYTNVKSGGFTGPLGSLRKLGLIEYPQSGTVAASQLLFPPGLS